MNINRMQFDLVTWLQDSKKSIPRNYLVDWMLQGIAVNEWNIGMKFAFFQGAPVDGPVL